MHRDAGQITDEWLVLRCQAGERAAMDLLVRRWHWRLYRHACLLTAEPEAANDAVQDAWLVIVRTLNRLRDPALFRSWAYRIVTNKCADWVRRTRRGRQAMRQAAAEMSATAARRSDDDEPESLRSALRQMPAQRRAMLTMLYLEDMSVREIAGALGVPAGTVKSRLYHARQELRAILERSQP